MGPPGGWGAGSEAFWLVWVGSGLAQLRTHRFVVPIGTIRVLAYATHAVGS